MRTVGRKTSTSSIKAFVITIAFIFLFTVALLLDVQYLYFMAVMTALLQPIAYGLVALSPVNYTAQRRHLPTAQEGKPFMVTLEISAGGKFPALALEVNDELPPALRSPDLVGSHKPQSWDGHRGTLTYPVEPLLRGVHQLGPARVETSDALGLFTFSAELASPTELVVHPTAIPTRGTQRGGEGRLGIRERDGKAQRGVGLEFHGVREYHPGDSLRRVHWRTSARTGRLAVVEFERAFEQDLVLAIDLKSGTHVGQGREATLEYAIKIAATLAERTIARGGGVALYTQQGSAVMAARSTDPEAARFQLFDLLARLQPTAETSLASTLAAQRLATGQRLAVLTAQADSALAQWLTGRVGQGDTVEVYYLNPSSFGGAVGSPPAVPHQLLKVVEKQHSPWEEGGRALEPLLRDH
jgi:uncharacterized protein (DUF58 family)